MIDDVDRAEERRVWCAEDERRTQALHNGNPDDLGPSEPPEPIDEPEPNDGESTTSEPVDLGPYLRGEIEQPQTSLGITRSDGAMPHLPTPRTRRYRRNGVGQDMAGTRLHRRRTQREPARHQHPLRVIRRHLYRRTAQTIRHRRLVDQPTPAVRRPGRPVRSEWLQGLLDPPPTVVVHDGINEAMVLHGAVIKDVDDASAFRRRLITPFLRAGAATPSV